MKVPASVFLDGRVPAIRRYARPWYKPLGRRRAPRGPYLSAQYHRLAARRGRKRALLALAHTIIVIVYRLLERGQDYEDLGANYFDERRKVVTVTRLVSRLTQLGYDVTLDPKTAAEAA